MKGPFSEGLAAGTVSKTVPRFFGEGCLDGEIFLTGLGVGTFFEAAPRFLGEGCLDGEIFFTGLGAGVGFDAFFFFGDSRVARVSGGRPSFFVRFAFAFAALPGCVVPSDSKSSVHRSGLP